MTSSPYPVNVIGRILNLEKHSHVIPQKTPKALLSSYLVLSRSYSAFLLQFSTNQYISKIHCEYLMTSLWRNRSWPEAEQSSAPYKVSIDYNKKELSGYLLPVFRKKYKTDRHLKNIHRLSDLQCWDRLLNNFKCSRMTSSRPKMTLKHFTWRL